MKVTFRSSNQLPQTQVKMPEGSRSMQIHRSPKRQPALKGTPLGHVKADTFVSKRSSKQDAFKTFGPLGAGIAMVVAGLRGGLR